MHPHLNLCNFFRVVNFVGGVLTCVLWHLTSKLFAPESVLDCIKHWHSVTLGSYSWSHTLTKVLYNHRSDFPCVQIFHYLNLKKKSRWTHTFIKSLLQKLHKIFKITALSTNTHIWEKCIFIVASVISWSAMWSVLATHISRPGFLNLRVWEHM